MLAWGRGKRKEEKADLKGGGTGGGSLLMTGTGRGKRRLACKGVSPGSVL